MDARELLTAAADHIDRWGWIQGSWYGGHLLTGLERQFATCSTCAGGALAVALTGGTKASPSFVHEDREVLDEAFALLAAHLLLGDRDQDGEPILAIDAVVNWNDYVAETQEQVVAALRGAAA